MWSAIQAPVPTSCWGGTHSFFGVRFLDNQLSLVLKVTVAGDLGIGDYTMPTSSQLYFEWTPRSGNELRLNTDLPGTLHITSLSATGIAGSFNTGFSAGGTIAGSFDVSF
jgi:hypothetical protein